ncbi:MAG TPA: hypothetical protein VF606_05090 [Geminicoccaceae bacterium]|jgi:hypothetical protein
MTPMKDRRGELRAPTRLQLLQVAGGLSSLRDLDLQAALTALYREHPVRWQAWMDDAMLLIQTAASPEKDSGFAETVQPEAD